MFTTIMESKSKISKKATIELDEARYIEIRTFLVTNLIYCDASIGHLMLHNLNTIMNVEDDRVIMEANGKMRYDHNMLDTVTDTPVMQAAAIFTEDYNSP